MFTYNSILTKILPLLLLDPHSLTSCCSLPSHLEFTLPSLYWILDLPLRILMFPVLLGTLPTPIKEKDQIIMGLCLPENKDADFCFGHREGQHLLFLQNLMKQRSKTMGTRRGSRVCKKEDLSWPWNILS